MSREQELIKKIKIEIKREMEQNAQYDRIHKEISKKEEEINLLNKELRGVSKRGLDGMLNASVDELLDIWGSSDE